MNMLTHMDWAKESLERLMELWESGKYASTCYVELEELKYHICKIEQNLLSHMGD